MDEVALGRGWMSRSRATKIVDPCHKAAWIQGRVNGRHPTVGGPTPTWRCSFQGIWQVCLIAVTRV